MHETEKARKQKCSESKKDFLETKIHEKFQGDKVKIMAWNREQEEKEMKKK